MPFDFGNFGTPTGGGAAAGGFVFGLTAAVANPEAAPPAAAAGFAFGGAAAAEPAANGANPFQAAWGTHAARAAPAAAAAAPAFAAFGAPAAGAFGAPGVFDALPAHSCALARWLAVGRQRWLEDEAKIYGLKELEALCARLRVVAMLDHKMLSFRGFDMADMNLAGRVFSGAYLHSANLCGSDLRDADFTGANLTKADLAGADLTGADFTGAVLKGVVNLESATLDNLRGANLAGLDVTGIDLSLLDLTGVVNLDKVAGAFVIPQSGLDAMVAAGKARALTTRKEAYALRVGDRVVWKSTAKAGAYNGKWVITKVAAAGSSFNKKFQLPSGQQSNQTDVGINCGETLYSLG